MGTTLFAPKRLVFVAVVAALFTLRAPAQDNAANEDVIQRYEQILERAPMEGPSLDKLLQIYQSGEGLEKLDARWAPWSTQPGTKGATYSLLRGLLADRMGKTDDARQFLQAATQAQPDDYHGWMALGDFEVRQGRWADATAALQKGLATTVTGEDRLSLYRKLGQAQERNLDLPSALATWQKMMEEFPKDPFALEEAGAAELDAEQFDEAKKTFQRLVDLTEPNSMNRVQALMRLADVDDRQGNTDAAVHGYEAILPLTADASWLNRELRAQIEQVYRRQDDLAGLVGYYRQWTKDHPKDVEALLLLSATLTELGKTDDALDVLRQVTVLAPDRHEVRESFAEGLVEAKQYDEAIGVLTALTADDPTEPRYWNTMGEALWRKTQPPTPESKKAVLEAWNHIAPADSKDVAAIFQVADLCHDHGLNDEALAGYQRALALSPDASDIREKAVKLLVEMSRKDNAWKLLDQMVEGDLATAANELKLAGLDLEFERQEAAVEAVRQGLAIEPGNFDLLSQQWTLLAEGQKWKECVALYDKLVAAAPNPYFVDQLEARQVQALTSAGLLDETEKRLHGKLGAAPGLGEGDLRLLLRIMMQNSDADVPKAIEEAQRRFPQSVSLTRMEIDYDRHQGNFDGAIAALQRMVESVPLQKTDWLTEMVHVRQDQGNLDDALQVAGQLIAASPTSADGYLLYADVAIAAGKPEDATAKLQAAIKLSDKPNEVRQRLARFYLENGNAAKARTVYDEAFAAAENPQDKLTIVRAMTTAYFQDGQVEELLNRFKKEQSSEESGWRYGLYLSAIYEQMEDFGAARRELAKSLAVRPQDTGLLHSLIGLAEKEGDVGELLKYRQMLAQADPSGANELALANEYAGQGKAEEAWQIVQKNLAEVAKDPLAWRDVLDQISDPDYAAKIKATLENAIRTKGSSFEGEFALAQFQIQQGDLDAAQKTLWEIMALPLPSTVTPKAGTSTPGPALNIFRFGAVAPNPFEQRVSESYMTLSEAQQLLMSSQNRGMAQMRMRMAMMRGRFNQVGVTTTLDPVAIRDHALIYLTLIAIQRRQSDDFLKNLETKIDDWHWPLSERIVAYSLIQAREPLMAAIEEQAKSNGPGQDIDSFCYDLCDDFLSQGQDDDPFHQRAQAVQAVLESRLAKDPAFGTMATMRLINRLSGDSSPDAQAKLKSTVEDYLKTVDTRNPEELIRAIELSTQVGDWEQVKKAVDELAATDRKTWSVTTAQELNYMPMSLLQRAMVTKGPASKETIPVVMKLIRLGYPTSPPPRALPVASSSFGRYGGMQSFGGGFAVNSFPPPNRYYGPDRIGALEPMFQQLKARNMVGDMYTALDQEEKDLTDWRKIYPILLRVYFQWWDDQKDEAIASVRRLLAQDSSDDYRQLLAAMLTQQQKYADAIPVLESISARYGPEYIQTQMQLLHTARLANDQDAGQKAGLRLLALRLPQQELMQILDDLRNVGLKDKADEIMKKQSGNGPGAIFNQAAQATNQTRQALERAARNRNGDATVATNLARQVLSHDPLAISPYSNETSLRVLALNVLKKFDQLDAYTAGLDTQLQATPDSVRLNWLAGEAYQNMDDRVVRSVEAVEAPVWLKLSRKANTFTGSTSADGVTWKDLFSRVVAMGPEARVGLTAGATTGKSSVSTWSNVKVTPSGPTGAPASPWEHIDLGDVSVAGQIEWNGTGAKLTSPLRGGKNDASAYAYGYRNIQGDGEMEARLVDVSAVGNQTKAGLCFRSRLDDKAPEIEIYFSEKQIYLSSAANPSEQSVKYFQRVAELDPRNQGFLLTAAAQMERSNRPEEAAQLYASILKSDFVAAMAQQSANVLQAFQQAHRLPQLMGLIQDWTPPPLNPMGGGMADMYYPLLQLGNTLRQGNQLSEAEQVYRKALTVDTYQSKQDGVAALVQVLIDENRKDDAGAEIEKFLLNSSSTNPAPAPALFAFNVRGQQNQGNWLQFLGSNPNGLIVAPFMRFLEMATDLGLAPKLREALNARADKKASSPGGPIDPDRVAALLLAIDARDVSYRRMVEKWIEDAPLTSVAMGNNLNAFLLLSQQLERWPQERPVALRLASAVFHGAGIDQNSYFKNIAGYQVLQIARSMDDHKTAQATLSSLAENMRAQRAINANQVSLEQALMLCRWMIEENMLKEATNFFADAKNNPQALNNNAYYRDKLEQVQNELAFVKGESSPVGLVYGLETTPQKHGMRTRIFWQINAGQKAPPNNKYFSHAPWSSSAATRPTSYRLEISGGADEDDLKPFATFARVPSQGAETIQLPPGVKLVQASLLQPEAGAPGASSDHAPAATGQLLFVTGAGNLFKNATFEATRDATGQGEIAGWHGLPSSSVAHEPGGPLPSGGFESFEAGGNMFGGGAAEIKSDRIAVQPNATYILSGWARQPLEMAVHYFDPDGKPVSDNQFTLGGNNDDRWSWFAYPFGNSGIESIPGKAAFLEFTLRPNQNFDLAGLMFQAWPVSDETTVPPPQSASVKVKPDADE